MTTPLFVRLSKILVDCRIVRFSWSLKEDNPIKCNEAPLSTVCVLSMVRKRHRGSLRFSGDITSEGVLCCGHLSVMSVYFERAPCEVFMLCVLRSLLALQSTLWKLDQTVVPSSFFRVCYLSGSRSEVLSLNFSSLLNLTA